MSVHSRSGSETDRKSREKLHHSAPIFPKVLPVVIPGSQYDELGFTLTEKVALRQAFDLIKPFRRNMGKDIFFTYLVQHEDVIDIFRKHGDPDEKIDLSSLHRHALTMMRTIHFVVNKGLDDMPSFHMMAHDILNFHMDHWVPKTHVQMLGLAIRNYVLNVMRNRCSESLVSGFDKVLNKFLGCAEGAPKIRQQHPVAFQEVSVVEISNGSNDHDNV